MSPEKREDERKHEPDDVREARSVMERHYNERVQPVSRYCERLAEYAEGLDVAIQKGSGGPFHSVDEAITVRDGLRSLRAWGYKSNLLARLLYGDEPLRETECPEHKGCWQGCVWPSVTCCPDGSNVTGWLPSLGPVGDTRR